MSITDELREYASNNNIMHYHHEYIAIADRIDAEHERQLGVLYRDMSDAEWVRLPKDADGEVIHIGDVMEWVRLSNKPSFEVRAMRYDEGGWEVFDRLGDRYEPFALRHYHAPTVEDVLTEMLEQAVGYSDAHTTVALNAIAEYAKRLRLVNDEE